MKLNENLRDGLMFLGLLFGAASTFTISLQAKYALGFVLSGVGMAIFAGLSSWLLIDEIVGLFSKKHN